MQGVGFVKDAKLCNTQFLSWVPQSRNAWTPSRAQSAQPIAQVKDTAKARDMSSGQNNPKRSLSGLGVPSFAEFCEEQGAKRFKRDSAQILQLNIGLYCNQACSHCHVESSPLRTEMMDREIASRCIQLLAQPECRVKTVDLTGGAPELNSQFRYLVREACALGLEVIDRCNLTVLLEPGQEDLVNFLARHQVRVVASLPCYSSKNVNEQRGGGVFERSIRGLQLLNEAGYGREESPLVLDLVYNPNGAFLAPSQSTLQEAYKQELRAAFGIEFNSLFCLNNMPIKRFADFLQRAGQLDDYVQALVSHWSLHALPYLTWQIFMSSPSDLFMAVNWAACNDLLVDNFNVSAANGAMCRDTVSVGWDGRIYDCDFNQQLALGIGLHKSQGGKVPTVFTVDSLDQLTGKPITCGTHCFGCTAGSGSSCQGSTA